MDASWETSEWYERWCEPIVAALWEGDKKQIRIKLAEAQCAFEHKKILDEEIITMNAFLAFLEFQVYLVIKLEGWIDAKLPQIISQLEDTSEYVRVNQLRARLSLQISICLDRMEIRTLDRIKYTTIRKRMGEGELTSETWYYIGVWAFKYGHRDILEAAFTHFFDRTCHHKFYNLWSYYLIKLMSNILSNCATKIELLTIINLAGDPHQLRSLKAIVWQEAEDRLLIDKQVTLAFTTRMEEFNSIPKGNRGDWFRKQSKSSTVSRHASPKFSAP